jgi:hypothetical protein
MKDMPKCRIRDSYRTLKTALRNIIIRRQKSKHR